MKHLLQSLSAEQRSLDEADFPAEVVQRLATMLQTLLPGAVVEIALDPAALVSDGLPPLLGQAVETRLPQNDPQCCTLAVPLIAEDELWGLLYVQREQPFSILESALILSLGQIGASALERLSWPANPLIFRQLVENANVAIDVADLGGILTYANKAAARVYGYNSPREMLGRNVHELYYYQEDSSVVATRIERAHTPDGWLGEVTYKYANGLPFPAEVAIFGLKDPKHKTPSYGAIIQNVSENYRLLTTMQQQTRRLESLNRVGTLLSSSLDRNRILELAAEQMVKLINVDHCGIVVIDETGKQGQLVAEFPPTSAAGIKIPLEGNPILAAHTDNDVFISADVPNDHRLESVRKELRDINAQSMLALRLVVKDKLIGSIGLDSTSRQRDFTEEEIETCRTVANQIALAVENSDLYAQALVANKLKSQFLATISHELRTPLNAILGYTEMVLGGIYGTVTDKQQDRLQRVFVNAQGLLELINDILDLSRIEAGKMRLDPEPLDIAPLLMGAVGNIVPEAEAKRLRVSVDVPALLPTVYADGARVRQILLNLLSNAIKFTREGSITISAYPLTIADGAATEYSLPNVNLKDGDWLAIAIADTGIGITKEDCSIIFDTFRQVDGSSIREYEGTGMGLAITKELVEMQDGKIWVESQIGKGSAFTFALPVITSEA